MSDFMLLCLLIFSAICGVMIVNALYKLRMKITGTDIMLVNMRTKILLYIGATLVCFAAFSSVI